MSFTWGPDETPAIEPHSKAKLTVLREYLRAYINRLATGFAQDEFKLDFVDGFAGGGVFQDGKDIVSGTPLIMLEETEAAKERLNKDRRKPLEFNCKYHFVDVKKAHTDRLQKVLNERGYVVDDEKIVIHNNAFENVVDGIIADIQARRPRSGRAIFLLDQKGYSQVALKLVARIFRELATAEVILTFASDALINFLSDTPQMIKAVSPLELTERQMSELIEYREMDGGRALAQRALCQHIRGMVGAAFDTPFFIRPGQSRRALWFVHLSRHPTARDVMIQRHWEINNTFEHYGPGDFGILGWDPLREQATLPLFNFTEHESHLLQDQLLDSLPRRLYGLISEHPITVDTMRHQFANETAARFSDMDQVLLQLAEEKEIQIIGPDGKVRTRALTRLKPTDSISLPATRLFPEISRFGKNRK